METTEQPDSTGMNQEEHHKSVVAMLQVGLYAAKIVRMADQQTPWSHDACTTAIDSLARLIELIGPRVSHYVTDGSPEGRELVGG